MMYKIVRNLKVLEQGYEVVTINEELNLHRIVVNNGETIITCDPDRKHFIINNKNIGTLEYKSSKGIVNRLWDLYR